MMNLTPSPNSTYLWIHMPTNYINVLHHPLDSSQIGYQVPLLLFSTDLHRLLPTFPTIYAKLHTNHQCVHISLLDPTPQMAATPNGRIQFTTTSHGNNLVRHSKQNPLANASSYQSLCMNCYLLPNVYKHLTINMMADASSVINCGRTLTMS